MIKQNRRAGLRIALAILILLFMPVGLTSALAQETVTIGLTVKNHQFQPGEIRAPANKRIVLKIKNLDSAAMEFESVALRVEKVVVAGGEGTINIRPLAPGRYNFFDDFNPQTKGTLVVE
jgi:heme/copper-type cytochrome/quinol oxidase subunit 2